MTAPGWSKRELDAEYGPLESEERIVIPTVLSRWFVAFKQDLLAGRVDLEELVAVVDADHQDEALEICTQCSRRPVRRPTGSSTYRGLCSVCYVYRLRDAHLERIAELEALCDRSAAKKLLQRRHDRLEPDRPRGHPPFRVCEDCGERLPARTDYRNPGPNVCFACLDLRERRHPESS